jgi:hypothetical protein
MSEAGRELDIRIAEEVFHAKVWGRSENDGPEELWMTRHSPHQVLPDYSTSIAAAWQVHQHCCQQIFSKRRAYLMALGELLCLKQDANGKEYNVAWPDAIMYLSPEIICLAALAAVEGKK